MPAGSAFCLIPLLALVASSVVAAPMARRAELEERDCSPDDTSYNSKNSSSAQFFLEDNFQAANFFDGFNYYSDEDPTHGLVDYVPREEAFARNLTYVNQYGQAVVRVDKESFLQPGEARKSVRLHSKKKYGNSLIVADIATMPHGCSVWPALWTLSGGKPWPTGGEIDIIEGVNNQESNAMTLHTAPGCTLDTSKVFSGRVSSTNCDANVNSNSGCGISDPDTNSYGHEFNVNAGGVFATLMDASGVRIWRFGRNEIPQDLASGNPKPESWRQPNAFWASTSCTREFIDQEQEIVMNISLCGDWAGSVYNLMGCPGTCADRVRDPANFIFARWIVNSIKIYKHT